MHSAAGGRFRAAAAVSYAAGIAVQLQQTSVPPAAWHAALAGGALLTLWGLHALRGRIPDIARIGMQGLLWAALGLAVASWQAALRLSDALAPTLEGRDLVLTGIVSGLPQPSPDGVRFEFDVRAATASGQPLRLSADVPTRVQLSWFQGWQEDGLVSGPPPAVRPGDRWQLPVRLRQPHGLANPHGFDAELWMFEQNLRASGSVRGSASPGPALLARGSSFDIDLLRQRMRDAILLNAPDAASAGVIAALAVGDQRAIDSAGWDVFRATGVAHLMSISGLHVTMFAWLAALLSGALWRCSSRLMLWVPAPLAARWLGVAAACGYALLAGWGVPAQRTLWMIAIAAALRSSGMRWPPLQLCAVAGAAVCALDPWALLQPGFWLSFAAVALLIASDAGAPRQRETPATTRAGRMWAAVRAALRTQWVASVGLAPLSLLLFHQVSIAGLLANLIAVPLVTLLVTPLSLLGMLWAPIWSAAAAVLMPLMQALGWLATWPGAVWTAAAPPPWLAVAALTGGALLVLHLPWQARALGALMLLMACLPPPLRVPHGSYQLLVPDVGQGGAVLVRTRRHVLLHDAGPVYGEGSDAGRRVLLPLLQARGETRVDLLMLSHRDSDHVGGAAVLVDRAGVAALSSTLENGHPLRAHGLPHRRCAAGQRWAWDGVQFEVLYPPAESAAARQPNERGLAAAPKPNAQSCVLRIVDAAGRSTLLTGDIEAAQEAALVAQLGAALHSDVLVVPHHGSRTSSTPAFVSAVSPRFAVLQAGYRNRYGHPAPDVVERWRAGGAQTLRSDTCGAWQWNSWSDSDGEGHSARCWRDQRRRYWQMRPAPG